MPTIYDDPEYMTQLKQRLETQPIREAVEAVKGRIERYEKRVRRLEEALEKLHDELDSTYFRSFIKDVLAEDPSCPR